MANLMLMYVGWVTESGVRVVPVGFGLMAPSGVVMVGASLYLRDVVQDYYGTRWVTVAIAIGICLTAILAPPQLAIASAVAFALSEICDLVIYTPLRRRSAWLATAVSGVVGSIVDSMIFLMIAFNSLAFVEGQIVGKLLITSVFAVVRWKYA